MVEKLKLFEGEIWIKYEDSRGVGGNYIVGNSRHDPEVPKYFIGENIAEVSANQLKLLKSLEKHYMGSDSPANRQDRDEEHVIRKVRASLTLREVSVKGFKISLERIATETD